MFAFQSNKEGLFTTGGIPVLQWQEAPSLTQDSIPEIFLRPSWGCLLKEFISSYDYLSFLDSPAAPAASASGSGATQRNAHVATPTVVLLLLLGWRRSSMSHTLWPKQLTIATSLTRIHPLDFPEAQPKSKLCAPEETISNSELFNP